MISLALGLVGTGIVALSLESVGVALVSFGIAGWLIKLAVGRPSASRRGRPSKWPPPFRPEIPKISPQRLRKTRIKPAAAARLGAAVCPLDLVKESALVDVRS